MPEETTSEYRLRRLEDRVDEHERIFVRLERYAIFEKAVAAIYVVLSLAAFGLLWKIAESGV